MVDTAPPKAQRPRKFLDRESPSGTRYYRKGGYMCDVCFLGDNKTCGLCVFARENVDGLKAGFAPEEAYRRAHKNDIPDSPLLQGLMKDPRMDLLPELPIVLNPRPILEAAAVVHPKLPQIIAPTAQNIIRLQRKLVEIAKGMRS